MSCMSILAEKISIKLYHSSDKIHIIDKRSMSFIPIVTFDGSKIDIYSNIPVENLNIVVEDDNNNIYSVLTTLCANQIYSFFLDNLEIGVYKIELISDNERFYGQFSIY